MKRFLVCVGLALGALILGLAAQFFQAWITKTPFVWNEAGIVELVGFVTGIVGVYLAVKEDIWNWPVGIVNVVAYGLLFFFSMKHYANGVLQLLYLAYLIDGWIRWSRKGAEGEKIRVRRAKLWEWGVAGLTVVLSLLLLPGPLRAYGGQAVEWDALTFGISLAAQFFLNRKILESWILWIVVDVIYVPLYVYRQYYPTALLYLVFIFLAYAGWKEWRAKEKIAHA